MTYQIGDRVQIVGEISSDYCQEKRDRANTTMTIRKIYHDKNDLEDDDRFLFYDDNDFPCYRMVEDQKEYCGDGWVWCHDLLESDFEIALDQEFLQLLGCL